MEDPAPTLNGSPGLAAFTPGITERLPGPLVFFDDIRVDLGSSQAAGQNGSHP